MSSKNVIMSATQDANQERRIVTGNERQGLGYTLAYGQLGDREPEAQGSLGKEASEYTHVIHFSARLLTNSFMLATLCAKRPFTSTFCTFVPSLSW